MSIRSKLIIYTFLSIFFTLIVVGASIDRLLVNLYSDRASTELDHSYSNFLHELKTIENDISGQTLLISSANIVITVSNLINNYQDKVNYQPLIFNTEKKKLATYLLNQITLSKAEQALIYSKKGELIAYAINNKKSNEAGFISYKNAKAITIKSTNKFSKWRQGTLPDSIALHTKPLETEVSFLNHTGKINYTAKDNNFSIENNKLITRNTAMGKTSLLGIVTIKTPLNDHFFKAASDDGHAQLSLLLHSKYLINDINDLTPIENIEQKSKLHRSKFLAQQPFIKGNYYVKSYIWPTNEGNNYLLTSSSRTELNSALNQTRIVLIIAFIITALIAIIFGIYWLNKLISKPLNILTTKATENPSGNLPEFPIRKGNDEISQLSKVLNDMVQTIKKREVLLVENEQQLSNTQKLAKIGGWKIDHNSNDIQFTPEVFNILEVDNTQNKASFELIHNAIHPDDIELVQKNHDSVMEQQIPYDVIHRLRLHNGKIKTVHVYSETIFDDSGNPITTKGTIQDITEQILQDEKLRRSQKMDAIGKLTGGVAHDFNNMLGVISGFTELLQLNKDRSDKDKKYIKEILTATKRATKLTSKLLSFSRQDNAAATPININKVLLDEQIMLEKILTVRIKLILKLSDNLWPIWLDKDELDDAIVNMSINAMHAMPVGGKLSLSTQNIKMPDTNVIHDDIPPGDYVLLSLIDTGTGMTPETLQKIYDPFFTTKDEMGTGLGMSQVYGFVKRSHGTIHINSELGHGTQIDIYFPRYISNDDTSKPDANNKNAANLTGSETILIVDDEPALRDLSSDILSSNGYTILTADSGENALEILKNKNVDLVLTDVIMPGIDGYQLSNFIEELYPNIKIQIISGFTDVKNSKVLNSTLHINRLQKPFKAKELLTKIKEHFPNSQ